MPKVTSKDPGSVLKSFLEAYQLNPSKLAAAVKLSQSTIRQITLNKMKISIPVALRFAKFFGNSVGFWTDIQLQYDLANSAKDAKLSAALKGIQKVKKPAPEKKPAAKAKSKTASAKAGAKKTGTRGKKAADVKKTSIGKKKTGKSRVASAAKKPGRKPKAK
jgi:addiction module HigA family antidote